MASHLTRASKPASAWVASRARAHESAFSSARIQEYDKLRLLIGRVLPLMTFEGYTGESVKQVRRRALPPAVSPLPGGAGCRLARRELTPRGACAVRDAIQRIRRRRCEDGSPHMATGKTPRAHDRESERVPPKRPPRAAGYRRRRPL